MKTEMELFYNNIEKLKNADASEEAAESGKKTASEGADLETERAVDLHVHSKMSDGTYSPEELVDYAIKKGLSAIALTDHDTVDGLKAIREYAAITPSSPEIVNGIELSTNLNGKDIHILGLFIDDENPEFLDYLKDFRHSRDVRNEKMCEGLRTGLHMDITFEKLQAAFPDSILTRAHYAKYMLMHGYVNSMTEAFDKYIGDDRPYYIPREKISPEDGIKLILKAKGVPVLAHPFQYRFTYNEMDMYLAKWKAQGLAAVEAYYTTHSEDETRVLKVLADMHSLLYSGGSDFHGSHKVNVDMGTGDGSLFVPESVLNSLKEYHMRQLQKE